MASLGHKELRSILSAKRMSVFPEWSPRHFLREYHSNSNISTQVLQLSEDHWLPYLLWSHHGHVIKPTSKYTDRRETYIIRADSRSPPSQWEMSLQSNAVSHWLGANLESAMYHALHKQTSPWSTCFYTLRSRTKRSSFCRQHFQIHVLERKFLFFDHDCTEVCS